MHLCASSWALRLGTKVWALTVGGGPDALGLTRDGTQPLPPSIDKRNALTANEAITTQWRNWVQRSVGKSSTVRRHHDCFVKHLCKVFGGPRLTPLSARWQKKSNPCWSEKPRSGANRNLEPTIISTAAKLKAKKSGTLRAVTAVVG